MKIAVMIILAIAGNIIFVWVVNAIAQYFVNLDYGNGPQSLVETIQEQWRSTIMLIKKFRIFKKEGNK